MRVLITGAQGFVGSYLSREVLRRHPDASVLGLGRSPRTDDHFAHHITVDRSVVSARLPPALAMSAGGRYAYEQADLNDTAALRQLAERFQPDWVIHLASGLRGDSGDRLVRANVTGTASLLMALGDGCRRPPALVLGSSGGVYGALTEADLPVAEDAPTNPADVYAVTKLASEQVGHLLAARYGMRYVVARLFNIVGPGQSERHVCGRFASLIAEAARAGYGTLQTGCLTSTRDYVDVRDAAVALVLLAASGNGTYNVASGEETATETVLRLLLGYAGLEGKVQIESTADLLPGVSRHAGDVTRLRALGYTPGFTLQTSLRDVLDYYVGYARSELRSHPIST